MLFHIYDLYTWNDIQWTAIYCDEHYFFLDLYIYEQWNYTLRIQIFIDWNGNTSKSQEAIASVVSHLNIEMQRLYTLYYSIARHLNASPMTHTWNVTDQSMRLQPDYSHGQIWSLKNFGFEFFDTNSDSVQITYCKIYVIRLRKLLQKNIEWT